MHRYAYIDPSNNTVVEKRTFPAQLAANVIKHVGGLPLLRPIEVQGMDLPCEDRWQRRVGPTDQVLDDKVIEVFTVENRDIEALAAEASASVDQRAEEIRLRFITPGSAKALVYQAKNEEVARWQADGAPTELIAADYPWAADRAGRLAVSIAAVLADWAVRAEAWKTAGIAIENASEAGKDAIASAQATSDYSAIFTARDQAINALDAIAASAPTE